MAPYSLKIFLLVGCLCISEIRSYFPGALDAYKEEYGEQEIEDIKRRLEGKQQQDGLLEHPGQRFERAEDHGFGKQLEEGAGEFGAPQQSNFELRQLSHGKNQVLGSKEEKRDGFGQHKAVGGANIFDNQTNQ